MTIARKKLTLLLLVVFVLSNSSLVIASALNLSVYVYVEEGKDEEIEVQEFIEKNVSFPLKQKSQVSLSSYICFDDRVSITTFRPTPNRYVCRHIMFRAILI